MKSQSSDKALSNDAKISSYFKIFSPGSHRTSYSTIKSLGDVIRLTANYVYGDDSLPKNARRNSDKLQKLDPYKALNVFNLVLAIGFGLHVGISALIDNLDSRRQGNRLSKKSSTPAAIAKSILTFIPAVAVTSARLINDGLEFVARTIGNGISAIKRLFSGKNANASEDIELESTAKFTPLSIPKTDLPAKQRAALIEGKDSLRESPYINPAVVQGSTFHSRKQAPVSSEEPELKNNNPYKK